MEDSTDKKEEKSAVNSGTQQDEEQPPPYTPNSSIALQSNAPPLGSPRSSNPIRRLFQRFRMEQDQETPASRTTAMPVANPAPIYEKSMPVDKNGAKSPGLDLIRADSTPQWHWSELECQYFIRNVLFDNLGYNDSAAQATAMRFRGRGENLFKKDRWDWWKIVNKKWNDAGAMRALIYYQREEEGAVPLDLLDEFGMMPMWVGEGSWAEVAEINLKTKRRIQEAAESRKPFDILINQAQSALDEAALVQREREAKEEEEKRVASANLLSRVDELENEIKRLMAREGGISRRQGVGQESSSMNEIVRIRLPQAGGRTYLDIDRAQFEADRYGWMIGSQ